MQDSGSRFDYGASPPVGDEDTDHHGYAGQAGPADSRPGRRRAAEPSLPPIPETDLPETPTRAVRVRPQDPAASTGAFSTGRRPAEDPSTAPGPASGFPGEPRDTPPPGAEPRDTPPWESPSWRETREQKAGGALPSSAPSTYGQPPTPELPPPPIFPSPGDSGIAGSYADPALEPPALDEPTLDAPVSGAPASGVPARDVDPLSPYWSPLGPPPGQSTPGQSPDQPTVQSGAGSPGQGADWQPGLPVQETSPEPQDPFPWAQESSREPQEPAREPLTTPTGRAAHARHTRPEVETGLPSWAAIAISLLCTAATVLADLAITGSIGVLFGLCFVFTGFGIAAGVRRSAMFTAGVLPPLSALAAFIVLGIAVPEKFHGEDAGGLASVGEAILTGLAASSWFLVAACSVCLGTLALRSARTRVSPVASRQPDRAGAAG